jgi:putative transposase
MGAASLARNARVMIENQTYVLQRKVSDTCWQLENATNGRILEQETGVLLSLHADGKLKFVLGQSGAKIRKPTTVLSLREKDIAALRLAYVRAVEHLPVSKPLFEEAIVKVWNDLNKTDSDKQMCTLIEKPPGWITVYRWRCRYTSYGNDLHALLNPKRRRANNHDSELIEICEEAIEKIYLTRERNTLQDAIDYAKYRVKEVNAVRKEREQTLLAMPTRSVLRRLQRDTSAFDQCAARYGRQAAIVRFRSVKGHRVTTAPLDRAEIDHTPLDLFVLDDQNMLPLGRPYVTLCVDDFTRCVLGMYVGFVPPSYLSVALCLKRAFMPKVSIREEYPEINNDWPSYGVMRELCVDQALEFHSEALEQACFRLGIEIHYAPRKQAWFKGKIEKLVGTLNREIAHGTRGTTFSNIFEKGDYNPQQFATVRLSTLKTAMHMWLCDVYHQRRHRTLGVPPVQMWTENAKSEDIRLPEDREALDVIMGRPHQRVLSHKGIEFEGLLYNSDSLSELRNRYGSRLQVEIRVDESDIGMIYVLFDGNVVKAKALNFAYADGISLWQHKLFQANRPNNDPDGYLESKEQIRRMFQDEYSAMRRRPQRGVGRLLEGQRKPVQECDSVDIIPLEAPKNVHSLSSSIAANSAPHLSADRPRYKAIIQSRSHCD